MQVSLNARGPAEPSEVWDRYVRPGRWPEWSPQLRRVSYDGGPTLTVGRTGRVYGPLGVSAGFLITAVAPAERRWSWRVTAGRIGLDLTHAVEPDGAAAAGGTRTTLTIEGPAPIVLGYLPLAQLALQRLVRA